MAIKRMTSNRNSEFVKKLREQKLSEGLPFMINTEELSSSQCYLEYPNGIIKLVSVESSTREMNVIKELNASDAEKLRKRFNFSL